MARVRREREISRPSKGSKNKALSPGPVEQTLALAAHSEELKEVGEATATILRGVPMFITILDSVSQIHPAVQVAVGTFKVVYGMYRTLQETDAKIGTLHGEMREMILVLCDLQDVPIAAMQFTLPDGRTKHRLEDLCQTVASDIKECANSCDIYRRKSTLYKVLVGKAWEQLFAKLAGRFARHKQEFQFKLSIATTKGVSAFAGQLDAASAQTKQLNVAMEAKFKEMMDSFARLVPPDSERELAERLVQDYGSIDAVRKSDKRLEAELKTTYKDSAATAAAQDGDGDKTLDGDRRRRRTAATGPSLAEFKRELEERPEEAMERNAKRLENKLEIMQAQLTRETEKIIERSSDRVIALIKKESRKGGANQLLDREMHDLWTEMGWRGHVKARPFVYALREFYCATPLGRDLGHDTAAKTGWLEYIDYPRLRHLLEVFDDDASGLVTVSEINQFTSSRPRDWTLSDWIIYWAVGWQVAMTTYIDKIDGLYRKMYAVAKEVLPENSEAVTLYLREMWWSCFEMTESFEYRPNDAAFRKMYDMCATLFAQGSPEANAPLRQVETAGVDSSTKPFSLRVDADALSLKSATVSMFGADFTTYDLDLPEKFRQYMAREEAFLQKNLESARYELDSEDMVHMVIGSRGKIEKLLFPLLYLVLKHHFDVIYLAREHVLDEAELDEGLRTIRWLLSAVGARYNHLKEIFIQQGRKPKHQFERYCCGLFRWYQDDRILSSSFIRDHRSYSYIDGNEKPQNLDPSTILVHEYRTPEEAASKGKVWHIGIYCDACGKDIYGKRIVCLNTTCNEGMKDKGLDGTEFIRHDTVDTCDAAECRSGELTRAHLRAPHLPSHDIVKLGELIHPRDFGRVYGNAVWSVGFARDLFRDGIGWDEAAEAWRERGEEEEAAKQGSTETVGENAEGISGGDIGAGGVEGDLRTAVPEATSTGPSEQHESNTAATADDVSPDSAGAGDDAPCEDADNELRASEELAHDNEDAISVPAGSAYIATFTTGDGAHSPGRVKPRCIACHEIVVMPCWYCAECPDDRFPFLCNGCEAIGKLGTSGRHECTHPVVRVAPTAEQPKVVPIERRLETLETRVQALDERTASIDGRLGEMMGILQRLAEKK